MQIEIIKQILDLLSFQDYEVKKAKGEIILNLDSSIVITTDRKQRTMCLNGRLPYKVISKLRTYGKEKFVFSELIDQGHYTYFTDSIKNILIVLSHLKDAFDKDQGKDATCVQKMEENKAKLNTWLLEQLNPSLTLDQWLNTKSMDAVRESIKSDNSTTLGRYFRKALMDFDKAVNPYLDSSITLKDYLDIEEIADFDWNNKGVLLLNFTCLEHNIKASFLRSDLRFLCRFSMITSPHHKIELTHDIVTGPGEKVIVYLKDANKQEEWTYNLTYGTISKDGINTDSFLLRPTTPLERDQLYDQLLQAKKVMDENLIPKIQKESPALQYVYRNPKTNKRPIS